MENIITAISLGLLSEIDVSNKPWRSGDAGVSQKARWANAREKLNKHSIQHFGKSLNIGPNMGKHQYADKKFSSKAKEIGRRIASN